LRRDHQGRRTTSGSDKGRRGTAWQGRHGSRGRRKRGQGPDGRQAGRGHHPDRDDPRHRHLDRRGTANGPSSKKMWPAALPQVIPVGADKEGSPEPAAFSPVNTEWVDLMAPGVQVYSTYELGDYAHWDGTSFATPAV